MLPEFGNLRAGSKTQIADTSPDLGATADVALVGEFLGGAVKGQAPHPSQGRRQWRGSTASSTPVEKGHFAASERGKFSSATFEIYRCGLSVAGLADSDVEDSRPAARPLLRPPRTRINVLRADVQRVVLAAMRWVDADSAVDEREALATLLKGCTGYALGVSSNVGSYEYSRVSLPDSVVDAPPLVEISRSFSHGCCWRRL